MITDAQGGTARPVPRKVEPEEKAAVQAAPKAPERKSQYTTRSKVSKSARAIIATADLREQGIFTR